MRKPGRFRFPGALFLLFSLAIPTAWSQTNSNPPPAVAPAPPPAAPAKRSQSDLEKLVAPIALYPDPLLATLLPASTYPLEIVQVARFIKDTNNISKLDTQPWEDNVKALARFPDVIAQMNDNIGWTSDLGTAFINQPKDVMDAIQTMRAKAQESGALKTGPQQVVVATNTVVTNMVDQQVVYVTNQAVQIEPAQPEVIYVPQYNPSVVYAGTPVAYPGYYYPPAPAPGAVAAASVVSFGVGMAVGAIVANNCDWGGGGCYHGGYHSDVNVNVNRNYDANINRNYNGNVNRDYNGNVNRNYNGNVARNNGGNQNYNANANRGQKWQPDQARLNNSGSSLSGAQSREARGWSSSAPAAAPARPSNAGTPSATGRPVNQSNASQQRSAFSGGNAAQTRQASARGGASRGGGGSRGRR